MSAIDSPKPGKVAELYGPGSPYPIASIPLFKRRFIFGLEDVKPITNLPQGATVRIRLRREDFGFAFVRVDNRIEQWALRDNLDGTWMLDALQSVNAVVQSA